MLQLPCLCLMVLGNLMQACPEEDGSPNAAVVTAVKEALADGFVGTLIEVLRRWPANYDAASSCGVLLANLLSGEGGDDDDSDDDSDGGGKQEGEGKASDSADAPLWSGVKAALGTPEYAAALEAMLRAFAADTTPLTMDMLDQPTPAVIEEGRALYQRCMGVYRLFLMLQGAPDETQLAMFDGPRGNDNIAAAVKVLTRVMGWRRPTLGGVNLLYSLTWETRLARPCGPMARRVAAHLLSGDGAALAFVRPALIRAISHERDMSEAREGDSSYNIAGAVSGLVGNLLSMATQQGWEAEERLLSALVAHEVVQGLVVMLVAKPDIPALVKDVSNCLFRLLAKYGNLTHPAADRLRSEYASTAGDSGLVYAIMNAYMAQVAAVDKLHVIVGQGRITWADTAKAKGGQPARTEGKEVEDEDTLVEAAERADAAASIMELVTALTDTEQTRPAILSVPRVLELLAITTSITFRDARNRAAALQVREAGGGRRSSSRITVCLFRRQSSCGPSVCVPAPGHGDARAHF
jgi:hypothetical protein